MQATTSTIFFKHTSNSPGRAAVNTEANSRETAAAEADSRAAVAGSWAGLSAFSTALAVNALLGLAGQK